MLPTVVYLFKAIRRAFRKGGRGLSIVADIVEEALRLSHAVRQRYPLAE